MTRQEARNQINARLITDYVDLKPSKGVNKYICPMCGSGTGKNNSGALTLDRDTRRLMCYACPENTGFGKPGQDTLGALRVIWGCSEDDVFARCGLTIDRPVMPTQAQAVSSVRSQSADLTQYFAECRSRLRNPDAVSYLTGRGISIDTAERCGIGYDAECDVYGSGHKSARLVIPLNRQTYIGRAISADVPKQYQKPFNKGGKPSIFNSDAIYAGADAVFVTEGIFDAMSVIEAGCQAIALNSVSNCGKLIALLQQKRTESTLILCLDNDSAGQNAQSKLEKELQKLNISYIKANISGSRKDANEMLTADRSAFIDAVRKAEKTAKLPPDSVLSYLTGAIKSDIEVYRQVQNRKTGFPYLDKKMRGLFPGLYILGAASSIGKSTFCWQIADQIAESGENVLFFALEMSRLEMVCKSIARTVAQNDITQAVDSLSLRRGYWTDAAYKAMSEYEQKVGDRMSVVESDFCGYNHIENKIVEYIKKTGKRPIVFIDYLQILEPEKDERGRALSTKESVDAVMVKLKQLTRRYSLTIFAVSSLNRASYYAPVDFDSFKESGSIEYGCDVAIGMQLTVMSDSIFDTAANTKVKEKREKIFAARNANPREIEIRVLKNRYGTNFRRYFLYYPHCDLFVEDEEKNKTVDEAARAARGGRL